MSRIAAQTGEVLLVSEVAERWRLCETTVCRAIREHKLRAVKFGKTYRLRAADVEAWIESLRTGASAEAEVAT